MTVFNIEQVLFIKLLESLDKKKKDMASLKQKTKDLDERKKKDKINGTQIILFKI